MVTKQMKSFKQAQACQSPFNGAARKASLAKLAPSDCEEQVSNHAILTRKPAFLASHWWRPDTMTA